MVGIHLARFDGSRDFIAQADFLAAGRQWTVGEVFDKSSVSARVLRQLYDHRKLTYNEGMRAERMRNHHRLQRKVAPPTAEELEQADKMAKRHTKPELLEQAEGLDIKPEWNKKVIALVLIRAGRGDT